MTQSPHPTLTRDYYVLLGELQSIDFTLLELTLYLDTHPDDKQILADFGQLQRRKQSLTWQYESIYGPLREYGSSPAGTEWTWASAPWPWQV